jgi:hypothetical protein
MSGVSFYAFHLLSWVEKIKMVFFFCHDEAGKVVEKKIPKIPHLPIIFGW